MSDAQLAILWHDTSTSIWLVGNFLNSAALWELFGGFMGLLIVVSLITMIISRIFGSVGFRFRE